MNAADLATVAVAGVSIVASVGAGVKWLVKHYLAELKPNGGGSMNDRVARIETQLDKIMEHLMGLK